MTNSNAGWSRAGLAGLLLAMTAAVSACQNNRMGSLNTSPAPLAAAPSGTVVASQLPPPSGPVDPSAFPPPPVVPGETTQVAAVDPALGTAQPAAPSAPAGAPDLTVGSVAGVWSANVAGQGCRVATPQTKFGQGYRAGPLRCPAPLDGVKSWNVAGKQLTLYDDGGNLLARLYSSGEGKFDGQMTSGQPISLSR